jgi:hypothetical protein
MLDTVLKNRLGGHVVEVDGTTPATFRSALLTAIDAQIPDDAQMGPSEKLKLAKLSIKLSDEKAQLSAQEIVTLLDRASKVLSILVYGQLVQGLDPKSLE